MLLELFSINQGSNSLDPGSSVERGGLTIWTRTKREESGPKKKTEQSASIL